MNVSVSEMDDLAPDLNKSSLSVMIIVSRTGSEVNDWSRLSYIDSVISEIPIRQYSFGIR